jgi:hypothetical protein
MRYLAAAGFGGAGKKLPVEAWLMKVAARVYGDIGIELPSKVELLEVYRRFCKNGGTDEGATPPQGLVEDDFSELLLELMAVRGAVITL